MFGKKRDPVQKAASLELGEDKVYITGLPLVILFSAICLNAVLIILYMTVIGTAVPSITTYFGTVEDVDWYGTAYMLALCVVQPLTGQIYNIFHVKATFLTFMTIFTLGTLISALSKTSKAFIVGRAVAGVGAAGLFNGSMVIITAAVTPSLRPQLLSMSMVFVGIGGVVGPVMGGAITEHLGWRWCLWIFLPPAALVAFIFLIQPIPEQVKKEHTITVIRQLHHKLDLIGFAIFTPAITMFLLAISWGGSRYAWNSGTTIGLLCGSAATIALFAGWIWHYQNRAIIPPRLFMKPVVLHGSVAMFLIGGAFLSLQYYLPLWFQSVKAASPQKSGVMMLPTCIAQILAGFLCTLLIRTIPYAPIWVGTGLTLSAIGSGLMTMFNPSTSAGKWIGFQVLTGIGRGVAMQMPILAAQAILPMNEVAIATATFLFFQYFGGAVANCIAKTIFLNALGPALQEYAPNVNAQKIIHSGATQVFKTISTKDIRGVILAYNKALVLTFWLPTACSIAACFFSIGLGWHKIGGKKEKKAPESEVEKTADASIEEVDTERKPKAMI